MSDWLKGALKSKTMFFAMLLAGLGAVQEQLPQLQQYVTPQFFGYFSMGVGVVVAILRIVTTQSLSNK